MYTTEYHGRTDEALYLQGRRQTTKDTLPAIAETPMGDRDCLFRMQRMDGVSESMKLYWRHKRNGKWTWTAAVTRYTGVNQTTGNLWVEIIREEE